MESSKKAAKKPARKFAGQKAGAKKTVKKAVKKSTGNSKSATKGVKKLAKKTSKKKFSKNDEKASSKKIAGKSKNRKVDSGKIVSKKAAGGGKLRTEKNQKANKPNTNKSVPNSTATLKRNLVNYKTYTIRINGSGAEMVCQKLTDCQSQAWKYLTDNGVDFSFLRDHVRYGNDIGISVDAYLGEWSDFDSLCHVHGCSVSSGNFEIIDEDGEEISSVDLGNLDIKIEESYSEVELESGAYFTARSDEDGQFFEASIMLQENKLPYLEDFTIIAVRLFEESIVTGINYNGKPLANSGEFDQETSGWSAEIHWI